MQALTQDICGLGASVSLVANQALKDAMMHEHVAPEAMQATLVRSLSAVHCWLMIRQLDCQLQR